LEAIVANDETKTAMLINAGANVLVPALNRVGYTGLHMSARSGNVKIMKVSHSYRQ